MFESDLVLWLQSFASEWLTTLMMWTTETGYTRSFTALAIVVTFGVDFRIGFVLFQMLLWNGVLTDLLKNVFALPRPAAVDSAVDLLGEDTVNTTPFTAADGDDFLDLPESRAVQHYRSQPDARYGLPSGHVSSATAFWLGSAVLLRSRPLSIFGMAIVFLMAISRMYLGRHFLADVLGGLALGILVVLAVRFFFRAPSADRLFNIGEGQLTWQLRSMKILAPPVAILPLLLLVFGPFMDLDSVGPLIGDIGRLMGANVAFALVAIQGLPKEQNGLKYRLTRVVLALLLYFITAETLKGFVERSDLEESIWSEFTISFMPPLVCLLGTVQASVLLRFPSPQK